LDIGSSGEYAGGSTADVDVENLLQPLKDWSRRREAARQAAFTKDLAPGRLVAVAYAGTVFGVLLDRPLGDHQWRVWMAAPECDWAGPHDVLLEPQDEPFDPLCGFIQTWNELTLQFALADRIALLGVLSPARMEAVRAVHQEFLSQRRTSTPSEPGRVALRTAGEAHSVLTGTPLLEDDPRLAYQALYRKLGLGLG
jgi:hypothetical protein